MSDHESEEETNNQVRTKSQYEQKKERTPQHHWCDHYRSYSLVGGKQLSLEEEHKAYLWKFMHANNWYGLKIPAAKHTMGAKLLKEIGGCTQGPYKCKIVAMKITEKMTRDGKAFRNANKLVPWGTKGKEVRTSPAHIKDLAIVNFLDSYTAADIPRILEILRAKFDTFDQVYNDNPSLAILEEERSQRRRARKHTNITRAANGEPTVPDTDNETVEKERKMYAPMGLRFYSSKKKEHYPDDELNFSDSPVIEELGAGTVTDGEDLRAQEANKRFRYNV